MFNLYKRVIKYAWYNVRSFRNLQTRKFSSCLHHSRMYSSYATPNRFMSMNHSFNIKNTTIELRKKLEKLNVKLENGHNITLITLNSIILHPCFEATKITKTDGLILLDVCNSINEALPEKRAECVWKIWEMIKQSGVIDLDTYHHLLTALRDTGIYVEIKRILDCLQKDGFSPTAETYTLLLECVCENLDFDGINFLLSVMKSNNYEVTEKGFNAILFATAKSSGLDKAEEYLTNASKSMNSGTYTSLLRGIAERPDSDCFNRLFNEARDMKIVFSLKERRAIVQSLIKGDLIMVIPSVLGPRDDWKFSFHTLLNLIARCLCVKNYPGMFQILNYMGDAVNEFSSGIEFLVPCRYVELLIAYMVRSRMPLDCILQYCFERDTPLRLKTAAYTSLRCGLFDDSLVYFENMKNADLPLRPHFFWPLFLRSRNEKEIFNVLSKMSKLGVNLDYDTALKYIIKRSSFTKRSVKMLEERGVPVEISVTPLAAVAIQRKLFSFALELCHKYESMIDYNKLYFALANSLLRDQEFDTVYQLCLRKPDRLLKVFHNLMVHFKDSVEPSLVEKFLNIFRQTGTNLFKADLNELRIYLKLYNLNEDIWLSSLVNDVNHGLSSAKPHLRDMNIDELENYLFYLRKNKYPIRQALRRLMIMHSDVGNVDRVMELKKELEAGEMQFSLGMKSALLKAFCVRDNCKEAYALFLEMKSTGLHEKLTGVKFLMLANTAAKTSLEVMYEILKSRTNVAENNLDRNCCRVITTVTEYHGVDAANKLIEFLLQHNYCQVKLMLFGPIMKHILAKNGIENATLACLKYANQYRLMPMKKMIICKLAALIVEEKVYKREPKFQPLLDKVLLTSGYLYGSSNTNFVYMMCLAEMGLLASLELYLKESFTGINEALLWHECSKLSDQNKIEILSNLEKVLKSTKINMEPIYISLLKIHCRRRDLKAASELLKSLEESKRMPSPEFLNMMAELQNREETFQE